jgi:hypothetical protein
MTAKDTSGSTFIAGVMVLLLLLQGECQEH